MFDKLILTTNDFLLEASTKLILKQADVNMETGEIINNFKLYSDDKQTITGKQLLYNADKFSVDINSYGLRIIFNPANYFRDSNFYTANNNMAEMVSRDIEKRLKKEIGIKVNIDNCSVARVDLTRNIELENKFKDYSFILSSLSMKRANKKKDFPDKSYTTGNKQKTICMYDKIGEMADKKHYIPDELKLKNILRSELRFQKPAKVKKDLGLNTLSQCYNKDYYQHLKIIYQREMRELFREKEDKPDIPIAEREILKTIKAENQRNGVLMYIATLGIERVIMQYGSLENFRQTLIEVGYTREYSYKMIRQIEKEILKNARISKECESKYTRYFEELRGKLTSII